MLFPVPENTTLGAKLIAEEARNWSGMTGGLALGEELQELARRLREISQDLFLVKSGY